MMSTESKYASVYHASVDWKNFEHDIPLDHWRFDIDLLNDPSQDISRRIQN